ncbi:MAG: 50S ribosomal protein L15 [Zetaproteobacteria bacterium CG12_big_fil_rev_8_21_14_0_65_55_1124]|nr:MAG: 50S ribosomal protein L15 [Zetaproteobacteria bacterium CG1_02_55_237]PIS18367.1 MAG: 50S ribosomal protein L15 [Zetaproteobacteria bacterium CG08_land_8_20_14_0_20_55_17]PIW43329.1 MAG: 50S ribosomal protein L15 [Zetaproteobacteria bacterium CG12_big_fil_rev_8_21_14_0_65_55_1124]PIY52183.1 MAG: 50S ribosomal protein L15 [Zetaproteobacteria bacterium CG_4_10_14_0_8_um_filter_55_43]PIZ37733.1 MAG: 50S ribosomal protein L15 [Zetaproteobacteria bacterium CG_4_10_14_0_2_um_filter_55_20]PJB
MKLNELKAAAGSRPANKRKGTGVASGQGKTGGRGHKGQKSRTGPTVARGFEGGQMPLIRRVPKRGFTPIARQNFQLVNVAQLERFDAGSKIDAAVLYEAGLIRNAVDPVKVLASGELTKKLVLSVAAASKQAAKKVEAAGGSLTLSGV